MKVSLMVGLFFAMVAIAPSHAAAFDPKSLVGQWSGEWTEMRGNEIHGKYFLTIERVQGNKVFGKGQVVGKRTVDFTVRGTFDGNRLSYGDTALTVDGTKMDGERGGDFPAHISLVKQR